MKSLKTLVSVSLLSSAFYNSSFTSHIDSDLFLKALQPQKNQAELLNALQPNKLPKNWEIMGARWNQQANQTQIDSRRFQLDINHNIDSVCYDGYKPNSLKSYQDFNHSQLYANDKTYDGRQKVIDTTVFPFSAHVRLEMKDEQGNISIGSGCFIGPYHILTAAHCAFLTHDSKVQEINVVPGANGGKQFFGNTKVIARIGHPLYSGENNCFDYKDRSKCYDDIALLITDQPLGQSTGWYGLKSFKEPTNSLEGKGIRFLGYPKRIKSSGNNEIFNREKDNDVYRFMYQSTGPVQKVIMSEATFSFSASCTGGNSGGGIFLKSKDRSTGQDYNDFYLIGVVKDGSTDGQSGSGVFINEEFLNTFIRFIEK